MKGRRWFRIAAVLGVGVTALPGCYQKVVSASGPGADRVNVEKGNAPPDPGSRTLGYPKYELKKLPGSQ